NLVRKGYIGFNSEEQSGRRHVIVAGLQPKEVAARSLESVKSVEEIERPGQRWRFSARLRGQPTGTAGCVAAMAAYVEAAPGFGLAGNRRFSGQAVRMVRRSRARPRNQQNNRDGPPQQRAHDRPLSDRVLP